MICPLREVLLLVLCATLSGTKDSVEIKLWGEQRLAFLRRFLPFERGIPAHDTLNDVINALDEELFKDCFAGWVATLREEDPHVIAIDGRTSRRSHARSRRTWSRPGPHATASCQARRRSMTSRTRWLHRAGTSLLSVLSQARCQDLRHHRARPLGH